jgi:hypothetical protein
VVSSVCVVAVVSETPRGAALTAVTRPLAGSTMAMAGSSLYLRLGVWRLYLPHGGGSGLENKETRLVEQYDEHLGLFQSI